MLEQLPAPDEIHYEVDAVALDEHEFHAYDEGVVHLEQYQLFQVQVLQRVVLDHYVFSDALHRIELASCLMLDQIYLWV